MVSGVLRPDNATISYTYDDVARTVRVDIPIAGASQLRRTTSFDPLGRPFEETATDAGGTSYSISESQYDPLDRAYKTATPHNSTAQYWTETRFDALGRVLKVIPPDGSPTSNHTSYSYSGNTVTITDPAGKQRKQQVDGLGRLAIAYEPDLATGQLTQQTSYAYNVVDALLTVTQGAQTRSYVYDDAGRLTSAATPESGTVSYQYNNFNQVTQRTDARGVITSYSYDGLNRPSQVSYNVGATGVPATPTVTYTYGTSSASNNNGRLVTVADGANTETYSYDVLGQVTQAQKLISGSTYSVGYAYNLAGELTSITYPEQYPNTTRRVVEQNYDAIGRLSAILSGATNYASGYTYNPAFEVTGFNYGNGVTATFGYTPERLLLQTLSYAKPGQTLFSVSYGYTHPNGGKNGQITNITDNLDAGRTVNYTYDALYRVSTAVTTGSATYPQWGLSWVYDRYGNRTQQTVTAGTAPSNSLSISATTNRITSAGFTYDLNGNLTQEGSASYQYQYDGENRMVQFNNGTANYTYLGASRIKKVSGSTTTVYVFSGSKVIAEYVNAALSKEYVYAGGGLLATLDSSGAPTYRHNDQLSARLETNSTATVTRTYGQFPYGEVWYETGAASKWKFTSYERDSESGLDYAIFRNYTSRLGRFMQADLLAGRGWSPQSLNRYTYVVGNPINAFDPLGLDPCAYSVCVTDTFDPVPLRDPTTGQSDPTGKISFFGGLGLHLERRRFRMLTEYEARGGERGGGGTNKGKAKEVIKNALKEKNLAECLNKFFGPGTILTNDNLPRIDASQNLPGAVVGRTDPKQVPDTGRATILIDKGTFSSLPANARFLALTYLHETANALAIQRFTNVFPRGARPFRGALGGPPTAAQQKGGNIGVDPDIGEQFEECLTGNR